MSESVSCQKCNLPRWLTAGLWFASVCGAAGIALLLTSFFFCEPLRKPNLGLDYRVVLEVLHCNPAFDSYSLNPVAFPFEFFAMTLSSAFIGGTLVGTSIMKDSTLTKSRVLSLGICAAVIAYAIFELEWFVRCAQLAYYSGSTSFLLRWNGISPIQWLTPLAINFLPLAVARFVLSSWLTIPLGLLAASLLNKNRQFFRTTP